MSRRAKRCERCKLAHATVTPETPACAPCLIFDMIRLERAELSRVVSWLRERAICFYCGEFGNETEHVVPRHTELPTWTVLACGECNRMASGDVFTSVMEKLNGIREKRRNKHARLLKAPEWSAEELAEMGYKLRRRIEAWQLAKECVESQLVWNPLEVHA
jgi:5-methylcytosine-specific restriction endonuclease McrA